MESESSSRRLTSFTSFHSISGLPASYFTCTSFRTQMQYRAEFNNLPSISRGNSVDRSFMMTATANDFSSRRNAPELTHFGEHGQRLFSSSAISVPENRRLENDSLVTMTVDHTFEIEKELNFLDILAGVVSRCSSSEIELKPPMYNTGGSGSTELCRSLSEKSDVANPQEHRVSCHRCGNIRKRKIVCERPQVNLSRLRTLSEFPIITNMSNLERKCLHFQSTISLQSVHFQTATSVRTYFAVDVQTR